MSAFDEYTRNRQREVIPGSIGEYLAPHRNVVPSAHSQPMVLELGANGISDWLSQNWKWVALGGLALFALASK